MIRRSILRLCGISAAVALAGSGLAAATLSGGLAPEASAAEEPCTPIGNFTHCVDFTFEGEHQTFTVPDDVSVLNVELLGAGGGGSDGATATQQGGAGGLTDANVQVTGGQELTVTVGGGGQPGSGTSVGGFGRGGHGGRGGIFSGGGGGGMTALWDGPQHR